MNDMIIVGALVLATPAASFFSVRLALNGMKGQVSDIREDQREIRADVRTIRSEVSDLQQRVAHNEGAHS